MKNYSTQSVKECLFFVFCLFCFLLLSNNTIHLMFYTYICHWNTFHYKYIIQIPFHVVKQSHVRVTSKNFCSLFIMFFANFRFISWSSPPPWLFIWPYLQLYVKLNVWSWQFLQKSLGKFTNIFHLPSQIYANILSRTSGIS